MTSDRLLVVENLQVRFGAERGAIRAVDGISLEVRHGEAVGIVGESGSGKSMTALALLRLVPDPGKIMGGTVMLGGRDLINLDDATMRAVRLHDIAMIFQDAGSYLNPVMTIGDQIAEAIGRRGSRKPQDLAAVQEALRAVQIADPQRVAASYPHELSGGMQQRALIASVLIRKPKLIIADEPTTALDATVQHRSKIDAALILISHDLGVVSRVCDRVYVMYGGQIVEEGSTTQIFSNPRHPYTQALLESMLDPFNPKAEITPLEGSPPDMADPPSGCRFHPRCRYAFDPCFADEPPSFVVAESRAAKCWLSQPVLEC
jgi:oligopeptide/dipeptide ABC transporter ATP-binding protein